MEKDALIGCIVIAGALAVLIYLVLWSRRAIDRIADSSSSSAREIVKELRRGR